jgi:hypothetical protein
MIRRKIVRDFVAFFVLLRSLFCLLARRIFRALRKTFRKSGVFYQTDGKWIGW